MQQVPTGFDDVEGMSDEEVENAAKSQAEMT